MMQIIISIRSNAAGKSLVVIWDSNITNQL